MRCGGTGKAATDPSRSVAALPPFRDASRHPVRRLPAGERPHTAIVTGTFGEAGALDRYGPDQGLPPVFSGHNSYLEWGRPGPEVTTVLAVDLGPEVTTLFASCEPPAPVTDTAGARTITAGKSIAVCRDPLGPWTELWPRFAHVDLGY